VPNARAPRIRALWGPTPPAPRPRTPNPRSKLTDEHAAFRLARRFEALRRVLETPAPHARRLARLMTRAVRRFPEIAIRFATTPARAAGYDPADHRLGIDATGRAIDASAVFRDTS
jgi:hypothetical protein